MARRGDGRDPQARGWFSKSGHTSHARPDAPREDFGDPTYHRTRPEPREERYYRDERRYRDEPRYRGDRGYYDERDRRRPPHRDDYEERPYRDEPRYREPRYRDEPRYREPRYRDERDYYDDRPPRRPRDDYDDERPYRDEPERVDLRKDTAPLADPPPRPQQRPAVALARGAAAGTHKVARTITRRVITASKSDGAHESGLTALIWNQVLSYGTDAMITVALAGTVFFGAAANAQRGNVLLYLLITMAPFAVVAPVIGPLLDRFGHGRRWAMAATGFGRAALALVMAAHSTELLVLYPCALGSLVLSKAYAVLRASAAPRLVPPGLTLGQANAKLTIFGLGSTLVFGGVVGIVIKITGSYTFGLVLTAIAFAVCGWTSLKLPKQIDSALQASAPRHPREPGVRRSPREKVPPVQRLQRWARRGFDEYVVIALWGECALRLLSGFLTIFLAFYVEGSAHGFEAAWKLGAVVGAAGIGNAAGSALGTRLGSAHPTRAIVLSVGVAAAGCLLGAIMFDLFLMVIVAMFVGAVANAMAKIALDSLIQDAVVESLRSSAFARSETFLQLAWVLGAAFGVGLSAFSATRESFGFWFVAVLLGAVTVLGWLRMRAVTRSAHRSAGGSN